MLNIGENHRLIIDRETEPGLFLKNAEGDEVLLPNKYIPKNFQLEDEIEVFVYLDHSERPVATTLEPYVKLDEFAFLECVEVTDFGAFLDWGLEKHLFVPFKEQVYPMQKGHRYLIFCYLDEDTNRLVASSKVHAYLDNSDLTIKPFEEVDLIVSNKTDLGYNVIINEIHLGLVYNDDVFQPIEIGDRIKGFIKKTRKDGKIDVTLQRPGYRSIEPNAQAILDELQHHDGYLNITDKSSPEKIKAVFKMSKKSFKRAAGNLYKQRQIDIKEDGIYLNQQN
ncbi:MULTISPECIES: CvfB family protein [unclassified Zunongwangia]|uniref:CvfB family protein n=1 Tax=unclassified Zunongwangia TaxID=2632541 RepID=UPI0022DD5DEC|nr:MULTISPECIES: S1-like domain-containing RNA-binding protein [unclassified Zunongwangia]WBL21228.1 S1-like domain-containing RNA-binding protein [Zunongwangia sp. HRR-M8]WBL26911.1 S1-like domain-containing RNA-binding protein [Zunongwangia sp. HGR-M22]